MREMWKGLWNERRKELIVYSYIKDGKQYTALSNAYRRLATKSNTKSMPICSDYGIMFAACDQFNCQIKIGYGPIGMVAEGIWAKRGSSVRLPLDVCCKSLSMLIVTLMM